MATILQYTGEGRGFLSGVTEYIDIREEDPDEILTGDKEPAPGFELVEEFRIEGENLHRLPIDQVMRRAF